MTCIFIVEDHRASRTLLIDVLEQAGYTVATASEAESGIPQILEALPDLVLMDVHMPGTDGLTAIRLLKGDARTARIPIIAVTALAMDGDRQRVLASGCDGYASKPIRYKELLTQIATLLEKS